MSEPTTLKIYRGADGQFTLYEDDGISQDYLKGKGTWMHITWKEKEKKLTIQPGGAPKGARNMTVKRRFKVELIPEGIIKTVNYNSKALHVNF